MIRLEPMGEEEFSQFRDRTIARRAAKWVERGIWAAEGAIETCRRDYAAYLPQGRTTPSHHFCTMIGGGMRVGEVWYTAKDEGGRLRSDSSGSQSIPHTGVGATQLRRSSGRSERPGASARTGCS